MTFRGLRERLASLDRLEREQLPFAAALALTNTAQEVKRSLVDEMSAVFDRPTRYTLNSLFLEPATRQKMEARVWIKDRPQDGGGPPATAWLGPQIYGGSRNDKRSESMLRAAGSLPVGRYIAPGSGQKLDAHGNISRGVVNKILSGLGAQQDKHANSTDSRRSAGNQRRYFTIKRGNRPLGIAERTAKGREGMRIVLAFIKRPSYQRTFDFFGVAERVADDQLPIQFELAMARALASRRG